MSEWREIRIGDIAKFNISSVRGDFEYDLIEYIDTSSVEKGSLIQPQIIPLQEAPSRAKRRIKKNDILISTVRPNLKHYYFVHDCQKNTIVSTGFVVITPKEEVEPYFLYCLLTTPIYTYYLTQIANSHTSTYPSFNPDIIKNSRLLMPEYSEQVELSKIIKTLDSKIDLLRRQNETLEAFAQTLFKRWFVEFEFPDENGLPYKSSGGKMLPSELGEIPEGWRVGKIGNICSILNEVIKPNAKERNLYFHYSIPAFDDGYSPKKEYGKDILSNKFCVKSNTILVSKLNPRKPRIWPILEIDGKKSISSTEFQVIKPIKKPYYCFIFNMFKSRYVRREMAQRATGTSGSHQRIRPDDILDIDVVISKENLILDFENGAKKMIEKIDSNLKTIQTLSQTRDILLPKLISGQIRVKEK